MRGPVSDEREPPADTRAPRVLTEQELRNAVADARAEGRRFGKAVARNAPALWLEAVLDRKPRMPSDLEARLVQGRPCRSTHCSTTRSAMRSGEDSGTPSSSRSGETGLAGPACPESRRAGGGRAKAATLI
jgi:hypothetical protein